MECTSFWIDALLRNSLYEDKWAYWPFPIKTLTTYYMRFELSAIIRFLINGQETHFLNIFKQGVTSRYTILYVEIVIRISFSIRNELQPCFTVVLLLSVLKTDCSLAFLPLILINLVYI